MSSVTDASSRSILPILVLCLAASGCAREAEPPKNLVLISLDTLRRDHLSTYGYPRQTSSNLDRLATEALVFERAFTHATNTAASHLTLFTGVLADRHHVWSNGMPFDGAIPTLASLLRAAGFHTAGFVSGVTMQGPANLGVGFELYDDAFTGSRRDGRVTVRRALRWLRGPDARNPYFLFVHLFDVHGPYGRHSPTVARFQSPTPGPPLDPIPAYRRQKLPDGSLATARNFYLDRYDDAIRYEDSLVGQLLAAVDLRSTLVVVVADHGESLDKRHWKLDHGGTIFDEELRVPLILRIPGFKPRRVPGMVGLADVMPTVLDLLRVKADPSLRLEGSSLVPYLTSGRQLARREIVSYAQVHAERLVPFGWDLDSRRAILGLRGQRWKVVLMPGTTTDVAQLYDLEADPGELHDLASEQPALRDRMLSRLAASIDAHSHQAPVASDLEEQLKSLGYSND